MSSTLPKSARGWATRERILRAATDAIAERGAARLGLEDVMARAEVSKGQIYHYFEHREALLHAAVRTTIDDVVELQGGIMDDLGTWPAIRAWFTCLIEMQVSVDSRGGCPLAMLAAHLVETDEHVRGELLAGFERWEALLATGLERMQASGELAPTADPRRLATATMASVQGGLVLTQVRRDPEQLRIALDAAWVYLQSCATSSD